MTTATLSIAAFTARPAARSAATRSAAAGRDIALSILGNILLIGIAALAALVIPVAAALAFGPALLSVL
ncbi:hypothetical protein [Microbacterium telephonicum]|uniref:Uncharacterized protein n=1 Tax=Microbacterium telephonicum TaxID=1714841 RepID=A0A498BXP7_9MICO|nr:hypothetical protein [Microbacterium telephonicum]RLK47667.1 hypothetical protein C7474_2264 [Microbacterium telephonicum]